MYFWTFVLLCCAGSASPSRLNLTLQILGVHKKYLYKSYSLSLKRKNYHLNDKYTRRGTSRSEWLERRLPSGSSTRLGVFFPSSQHDGFNGHFVIELEIAGFFRKKQQTLYLNCFHLYLNIMLIWKFERCISNSRLNLDIISV